MTDWPTAVLGEIATVVDCEHKTAPVAGLGDEFGWSIGTSDIRGGRIEYSGAKRVSRETFDRWSRRAVPREGDLVLAREAPVGQVGRIDPKRPTCLGQRTVLVRADPSRVEERYLHAYLLGPYAQRWMADRSGGSTVAHLNVADVREIPVALPTLTEQRRIAGVLGVLDELIDVNRQLARTLEDHMLALFAAESFDGDPGVDSVSLGDLVTVNPKLPKPPGEAPYVDMAALPTDSSRIGSVVRRAPTSGSRFQNSDTLFARLTPCLENGKAAFVDVLDGDEVAIGSTEFLVLRDKGTVGSHWPYLLTRSRRFRDYAIANMNGSSGRQRVSAEVIASYPMAAPDVDSLSRFRSASSVAFAAIRGLDEEIADLTRVRDELLPVLMSDRVRTTERSAVS